MSLETKPLVDILTGVHGSNDQVLASSDSIGYANAMSKILESKLSNVSGEQKKGFGFFLDDVAEDGKWVSLAATSLRENPRMRDIFGFGAQADVKLAAALRAHAKNRKLQIQMDALVGKDEINKTNDIVSSVKPHITFA